MAEKKTGKDMRKAQRKPMLVTTVLRRQRPGGGYEIMEFRSRDISEGGIFVCAEDLGVFDLGEELEILVDDAGARYYEGKARVVRSSRVFTGEAQPLESGFGLMFLSPDTEFSQMLARKLKG